jgi:hypothetical protein
VTRWLPPFSQQVKKNKNDDSYSAFVDFLCCFQPSYSYDFACSWRKSGNSSQYKRLNLPQMGVAADQILCSARRA